MNNYYVTYKRRMRRLLYAAQGSRTDFFKEVDPQKKKIIVALAADYSNLGDVAITYAQTTFLEDSFPDYQIVDYPISQTFKHFKDLKDIVQEGDIITTVGGGNTGDMYDSAEQARQFLIKQFPDNRIISFPQTVDFSDTPFGKHMLKKAQKAYSAHPDLTLIAREEQSYEFYKTHFPNNKVLLFPDIVLYLDETDESMERKGITLTFRNDKEKKVSSQEVDYLVDELTEKYGEVRFRDTHVDKTFSSVQEREESLQEIWDVFRSSSVVVTDRLHGMIFSAVTGTPCVAINNSNRKVSRVYDKWLTEYPFIKMVEEFHAESILNNVEELLEKEQSQADRSRTMEHFMELKNILKQE